ncbi:hypothetical protein ACHAPO_012112 [Fusarium lateritium]
MPHQEDNPKAGLARPFPSIRWENLISDIDHYEQAIQAAEKKKRPGARRSAASESGLSLATVDKHIWESMQALSANKRTRVKQATYAYDTKVFATLYEQLGKAIDRNQEPYECEHIGEALDQFCQQLRHFDMTPITLANIQATMDNAQAIALEEDERQKSSGTCQKTSETNENTQVDDPDDQIRPLMKNIGIRSKGKFTRLNVDELLQDLGLYSDREDSSDTLGGSEGEDEEIEDEEIEDEEIEDEEIEDEDGA